MDSPKKFIVSHAPFWHDGSGIKERSYNTIAAALPALLLGFGLYGLPAVGVISLSISTAVIWEYLLNRISGRPIRVADGNSAVIGMLFGMLLPATVPWWLVVTGTFICIVIGKEIFGGIGGNPFNPALLGLAMLTVSWTDFLDFNEMLVGYDFGFPMIYPLTALKYLGLEGIEPFSVTSLLLGQQIGGIGATFGLGLILGGIYLIARGFVRWEITLSFLAGIFVTAFLFYLVDPTRYASPLFHLSTGYTLIGAFFLAPEDSSSPVNFAPMLIYGAGCGILTVLIRTIGTYVDGVVFAILLMNIANPLLDKIRPKALGKVV